MRLLGSAPMTAAQITALVAICGVGAFVGWALFLRLQRQNPMAQRYAPTTASDRPLLWKSRGGIRLPLAVGGLTASWPLVSYNADDLGIKVRGSFVPPLDLTWDAIANIEAVSGRAFRLRTKDRELAFLAIAVTNRDALLGIAGAHGVVVESSPQPARWWSGGGL